MENAKNRNPRKKAVTYSKNKDISIKKKENTTQKTLKLETPTYNSYQNDEIPEEVRKIAELRKNTITNKNSSSIEKVEKKVENYDFDLRQAVIQAAILERPYR